MEAVTVLTYAGTVLGSMIAGVVGAKKLPMSRNGKHPVEAPIEPSDKTKGAKFISEEGLEKYNKVMDILDTRFMTLDKHGDKCQAQQSDMKLYIADKLNESTQIIIKELKS